MVIANSREISIANAWTLSPGGTLTLDGNSTAFASADLRSGEIAIADSATITGGTLAAQRGLGTSFDADDLADWQTNFGAGILTASPITTPVPEPGAGLLAMAALWQSRLSNKA